MRKSVAALLGTAVLCAAGAHTARADVGWSEEQYTQAYGQGQRGFAKVNERAYHIGQNVLVVEFSPDNLHSLGELWVLGVVRDNIPDSIKKAGDAAQKGPEVERVKFAAKSAIPAEIHEAVVDDVVVRVDIRNQLVTRIALCGKKEECGLWRRIFGPACQTQVSCPVLERALSVDRTMDDMHQRAEQAVERMTH